MFLFGGTIGSLMGGSISSYLGRKMTMVWFGIPSAVAWLILAFAVNPEMAFIAIFVKGLSSNIAYISVGKIKFVPTHTLYTVYSILSRCLHLGDLSQIHEKLFWRLSVTLPYNGHAFFIHLRLHHRLEDACQDYVIGVVMCFCCDDFCARNSLLAV
jgi:hypothetical protein